MKKTIFAIAMLLTIGAQAQTQQKYQINGSNIVAVAKQKKEAQKTSYTYTIKGKAYQVYQGAKGSYYIIRVSGKTGKEYKYYLPKDVQQMLKTR